MVNNISHNIITDEAADNIADMYVFCTTTIYYLVNLDTSSNYLTSTGCICAEIFGRMKSMTHIDISSLTLASYFGC